MGLLLRLSVLLALSAGAAAQEPMRHQPGTLLPGIGADDPRRAVDRTVAPWRALGRVQTEIGGRCTGVLVGPRTVLTAAHCLVSSRTGSFVQPRSVHFLLGYDRGEWAARAGVTGFVAGPDYRPGRGPAGADWALLTLDAPLGTPDRVLMLLRTPPAPRTAAMLGGYQQDRPEVLLADTGCRVIGVQRHPGGTAALAHDCAGTRGSSGAPLLVRDAAGRWAVAGVQAAAAADMAFGQAAPAGAVRGLE